MTQALQKAGMTVLCAPVDLPVAVLARALAPKDTRLETVETRFAMPLPPRSDREYRSFQALSKAVQGVLASSGMKVADVAVGHFEYEGSPIADDVAITQSRFGEVSPLDEVRTVGTGFFSSRKTLVLNADHGAVSDLVQLAAVKPNFAAYLLCKLFFLGANLDAMLDGRLAAKALERAGG